jgi:hypothetical protein
VRVRRRALNAEEVRVLEHHDGCDDDEEDGTDNSGDYGDDTDNCGGDDSGVDESGDGGDGSGGDACGSDDRDDDRAAAPWRARGRVFRSARCCAPPTSTDLEAL